MDKKTIIQKQLALLEGVLVNEFRTCQSLQDIVAGERLALSQGNVPKLSNLVEEKEVLLDQLGQIEDERRKAVQELSLALEENSETPTVFSLLSRLNSEVAGRLGRLCDGISTIVGQVRQYNDGNQALAASALERVDIVQNYLLSLIQIPENYQPPGSHPIPVQSIVWDFDQKA